MIMDWTCVERAVGDRGAFGSVGVSVIAPNGERWEFLGQRPFRAASTVKIPVMIEVYRQIDRGACTLADCHTLAPGEKVQGSGVLLHLHDGLQLTVNDLIYLMISISDNTATNILIRKAGLDAINATMRELGMTHSNLGREMKGRAALPGEEENWATPHDYATIVKAILDQEAASAASCEAMLAMLEKQQNPRRIARFLPERTDIRWGSKTGELKHAGVTNDVGFVISPEGRLIVAVFCEGMPDPQAGEQLIGEISRAAMRATGVIEPLL
jgi:beta-lactamase class A